MQDLASFGFKEVNIEAQSNVEGTVRPSIQAVRTALIADIGVSEAELKKFADIVEDNTLILGSIDLREVEDAEAVLEATRARAINLEESQLMHYCKLLKKRETDSVKLIEERYKAGMNQDELNHLNEKFSLLKRKNEQKQKVLEVQKELLSILKVTFFYCIVLSKSISVQSIYQQLINQLDLFSLFLSHSLSLSPLDII
jgi:hypothetical protein